jgi:hypothetical protein
VLPHHDHHDEDAFVVTASAEQYWMRFFAALRMTAAQAVALRAGSARRALLSRANRVAFQTPFAHRKTQATNYSALQSTM